MTLTSSIAEKVRALVKRGDGRQANSLLQEETIPPVDSRRITNVLREHCKNDSNTQTLPPGLLPDTLEEAGVPVVYLPTTFSTADELLEIITDAVKKTSLLIAELEALNENDEGRAAQEQSSLIELSTQTRVLYASETKRGRPIVGSHGNVTIYWCADRSKFASSWLSGVIVEVRNLGDEHAKSERMNLTATMNLDVAADGSIRDAQPTVAGREDGFGISRSL